MKINGKEYWGKKLLEKMESIAREGYFFKKDTKEKLYGMDMMWYLWTGAASSLFGKDDMTTFERYFIEDTKTHKENKNPYFKYRDSEEMCDIIFKEFGLDPNESHIINGHVPVEKKKGESPIKAGGKLLVIDGGFSRAYQKKTGTAGYTLIYNSYSLQLVSHQPFTSSEEAILNESDILSTTAVVERKQNRRRVKDTDAGVEIQTQIDELKLLLLAYRKGLIKES
jgi:fructose-1,6-bisphosphatase-3